MIYILLILVADYNRRCKLIQEDIIQMGYDPRALFQFLLNTAQFEFLLQEVRGGEKRRREREIKKEGRKRKREG